MLTPPEMIMWWRRSVRVSLTLVVEVADIADGRPAPLDRAGLSEVRWYPPVLSPEALSPEALKDYGKQ